ncbi:hypothetical protein [Actinomadura nitritigenes]|uniref:hypothetical protein n=1 Tax=Actinomadura nitritigenes TaxID=134602 RepID=UPI003D8B5FE2
MIVPALLGAGVAAALAGAPAASAATAPSGEVSAAATHHKSASCASPKGSKINISWGDGNVSTTVYYNNHCSQKRAIWLDFRRSNGSYFSKCFVAPAKTKSHKKIGNSMPYKVSILSKGSC